MKVNDLSIRIKIISGFVMVALLVILTGITGYRAMVGSMRAAAMVDAAMEMKLSVRSSMQLLMEVLVAGESSELESAWQENHEAASYYLAYSQALLQGGEVEVGYLAPVENQESRGRLIQAQDLYEKEFRPGLMQLHDLKKNELAGLLVDNPETRLAEIDDTVDGAGIKIMEMLDTIEVNAREEMKNSTRTAIFMPLCC